MTKRDGSHFTEAPLQGQADKADHGKSDKSREEDVISLVRATNAAVNQNVISHWGPNTHQILIMATLSLISLMVALNACIIVTCLNSIILDLNLDTTEGIWIGTSYLLTDAVTMPFLLELSNIFGRPIILMASLCSFLFGTICCCVASDLTLLLAGRVFQGVGGAGITVLSLVIFTDMVPLRWRPKWYGFVLGAWALGNCMGPVIGGIVVEYMTWRWVFYIMVPLCVIGLLLVAFLLKFRAPSAIAAQSLRRVDWAGGGLFTASGTLLLVAISWGGVQFDWKSACTLVPLLLGAVGLVGTVLYEGKVANRPFLRRILFCSLSARITYFCGALQGFLLYGQLYYIPFYFLAVKGFGPVYTGLTTLPVMVTCVSSSMITGLLIARKATYRWAIWMGWAILLAGSGLTILLGRETTTPTWAIILIVVGFGHGAILNAQNCASHATCQDGEETAAAAMYAFAREFGMALGVGIGGSAFQNTMLVKVGWEGIDTFLAVKSEAFVQTLWQLPANDVTKSRILDAYVFGLRSVFILFTCVSAVAFLLSLFSKQYKVREESNSAPNMPVELA